MADFGAAMSRCGIPYSGGERESFFETLEISTVYSLLQIIDNPRQDVPLIAVLRSPLLGFTPDLLAAIRSCGKGDFYDACCQPGVRLAISTGEQRIFSNLLITIGVA